MTEFSATLEKYDFGKYFYTVVYFPQSVTDVLPLTEHPRLRVHAIVNGYHLDGALMPDRIGSKQTKHLKTPSNTGQKVWYLLLGKRVLNSIKKQLGEEVTVFFAIADQEAVNVPRILEERLLEQPRLQEIWDSLTAGKKRGLVHPLNSAKSLATKQKRLEQLELLLLEL
jgi:hypothetical protein